LLFFSWRGLDSSISTWQVAETSGPARRIVGLIRGTVKSVATGKTSPDGEPVFANVGYILGLRVATSHR
jgi:hypothetical protein